MSGDSPKAVYFQLALAGREAGGLFTAIEGGGSETAVIEQKVALPDGKGVEIKKIPGNLKFNPITLRRGIDVDRSLWDWRQQVVDGAFKQARSDGTITLLDEAFMPLTTFTFRNGWVTRYTFAIGQDQAAIEEITIAIEDFRRE